MDPATSPTLKKRLKIQKLRGEKEKLKILSVSLVIFGRRTLKRKNDWKIEVRSSSFEEEEEKEEKEGRRLNSVHVNSVLVLFFRPQMARRTYEFHDIMPTPPNII